MKPEPFSVEAIARICHEANRELQRITGDPVVSNPWYMTDAETKQSAIEGVQKAIDGATPEQLHESWCEFKIAAGWVYGPKKDAVAKTHPCLVPYEALPTEQRAKDALFHAIVGALAGTEG